MFDDYRTGNGSGALGTSSGVPMMLHDTGMVQTIAPSSLFSKDDAVPTGSGTATFQNVETTRMFTPSAMTSQEAWKTVQRRRFVR